MPGPLASRAAGSLEWENPGSLRGEDAGATNEIVSFCVWSNDAGYGVVKETAWNSSSHRRPEEGRHPDTEEQVRLEGQQGQCPFQAWTEQPQVTARAKVSADQVHSPDSVLWGTHADSGEKKWHAETSCITHLPVPVYPPLPP